MVERLIYNRVCRDNPFSPEMLPKAVDEALNVFQKYNYYGVTYDEDHSLTISDLRTIMKYTHSIWGNTEIYIDIEEKNRNVF